MTSLVVGVHLTAELEHSLKALVAEYRARGTEITMAEAVRTVLRNGIEAMNLHKVAKAQPKPPKAAKAPKEETGLTVGPAKRKRGRPRKNPNGSGLDISAA